MRHALAVLACLAFAALAGAQESELAKITGETCTVLETTHFRMDTFMDAAGNQALAEKCEKAYEILGKVFPIPETGLWRSRCRVFGCQSEDAWFKLNDTFKGDQQTKELRKRLAHTRQRGKSPIAAACMDHIPLGQSGFDQAILHNVGHVAIWAAMKEAKPPMWIDEGFASWLEMATTGHAFEYCVGKGTSAVDPKKDWKNGDLWIILLKEGAQWKKDVPLDPLRKKKDFNDMSHEERAKAWSIVDFLIATDAAKFAKFILALKDKVQPKTESGSAEYGPGADEQALCEAYDPKWSFAAVEREWRSWIAKK